MVDVLTFTRRTVVEFFVGLRGPPCSLTLVAFTSLGFFHRGRKRSFSTESAASRSIRLGLAGDLPRRDTVDFYVEWTRPRGTHTKIRAGGSFGKYLEYTAFTAANLSTEVQYTLHLRTPANEEPAASRQSFICSSTSSV